jgi:hypothetical protein
MAYTKMRIVFYGISSFILMAATARGQTGKPAAAPSAVHRGCLR